MLSGHPRRARPCANGYLRCPVLSFNAFFFGGGVLYSISVYLLF